MATKQTAVEIIEITRANEFGDFYGDIQHPNMNQGLLESIRMTTGQLLAERVAIARNEDIDLGQEDAVINYLSQWYEFDYGRRAWVPIG